MNELVAQPAASSQQHLSPNQKAWLRFKRNRPAVIGTWFLLALALLVVLSPWIIPYNPNTLTDAQFQPPSAQHWFGTDVHGRDLLARIFAGARISLLVGAIGAGVSLLIGVLWGAVAGYVGGRWDSFMMRSVDILYSMPPVIFVIVLVTTLEARLMGTLVSLHHENWTWLVRIFLLLVGLCSLSWLTTARIVRGQVLSLRNRQFVEASRTMGAGTLRILRWHILPNVLGVVIVYLTLTVPAIILYESFLSYLGLGIQPPMASWGSLIAEGANQMNPIHIYWWLLAFPAAFLVATLLALNFVGDGLRDAWDVRGGG
ncbi:MAG: Binding-protein-dependent transport system inner rane component [Pedosphaera sp.]|nr:Binding-protein-dependent transport system inner rane component [Pedosphaera sp.]